MRDVLATLSKLPEKCAAVIEGQAVFIRRGAREAGPAHMGTDQVDQWNAAQGIHPHVRLAMEVGLMMGWDADGADPDTHAADLGEPEAVGPFLYEFAAELTVTVKVTANSEQAAAEQARERLNELATDVDELVTRGLDIFSPVGVSDTIDLIETTDPR